MPKRFSTYWYKEGPEFTEAFLYNLRDNDVQEGGSIAKGAIVQGPVGFVAAESEVFGWTGKLLPFNSNRRCEWHDFELPCMASPSLPAGKVAAGLLRAANYAVAAITSDEVKALADKLKIPAVKTPAGRVGHQRGTGAVRSARAGAARDIDLTGRSGTTRIDLSGKIQQTELQL